MSLAKVTECHWKKKAVSKVSPKQKLDFDLITITCPRGHHPSLYPRARSPDFPWSCSLRCSCTSPSTQLCPHKRITAQLIVLTSPPQQSRDRRSGLHSFGWTTATEWNCRTQQSCGEQVILFVHSWGEGVGVLLSRQPATLESLRCTLDNEYEKVVVLHACFYSLAFQSASAAYREL